MERNSEEMKHRDDMKEPVFSVLIFVLKWKVERSDGFDGNGGFFMRDFVRAGDTIHQSSKSFSN